MEIAVYDSCLRTLPYMYYELVVGRYRDPT